MLATNWASFKFRSKIHHFRGKLIARGDADRWTVSINIKVKALLCTTFVPVASSLHRFLRWCHFVYAACLHAPIYPSMDAGLIVNINYETCTGHTRLWYSDQSCETWREKGFSFSPSSLPLSKSFLSLFLSRLSRENFTKVSEFISTGVTFDKFQTDALHLVKIYTPRPIK